MGNVIKFVFFGIIFGCLLGLLLGVSLTSQTKKSTRKLIDEPVFILTTALGGIAGLIIGISVGKSTNKDEKLGLDKLETYEFQHKRKWGFITKWKTPDSGEVQEIKTEFIEESGSYVTTYNESQTIVHHTNKGDKKSVYQLHIITRNKILEYLRSNT